MKKKLLGGLRGPFEKGSLTSRKRKRVHGLRPLNFSAFALLKHSGALLNISHAEPKRGCMMNKS